MKKRPYRKIHNSIVIMSSVCLALMMTSGVRANRPYDEMCRLVDAIMNNPEPVTRSICELAQRYCVVHRLDLDPTRDNPYAQLERKFTRATKDAIDTCLFTAFAAIPPQSRQRYEEELKRTMRMKQSEIRAPQED